MAYLLRVVFVVVALLGLHSSASATVVPVAGAQCRVQGGSGVWSDYFTSCNAAAASRLSSYPTYGGKAPINKCTVVYPVTSGCVISAAQAFSPYNYADYGLTVQYLTACPANSTASGSSCLCNANFNEGTGAYAGTCVPKPTATEKWRKWCHDASGQDIGSFVSRGKMASSGCLDGIDIAGSPVNTPGYSSGDVPANGGCSVVLTNRTSYPLPDGTWETVGSASLDGGTCVASTKADPVPDLPPNAPAEATKQPEVAKPPCPAGEIRGQVNGTDVCAKAGDESPKVTDKKNEETNTNPDGSTTKKETQQQTECTGDKCTTTTGCTQTDTSTSGTKTVTSCGQSTSTGTRGDFCKENVGSAQCGGEGSFTGTCAAGFQVKGEDPVINAMALEQYKRNCTFFEKDTNAAGTVNKILAGADTQNTDAMKTAAGQAPVSVGSFDTNGRGWGRSCPPDPSFSLPFAQNRAFALPFGKICDPLQLLSLAGVSLTLLASFAWVMGGKR